MGPIYTDYLCAAILKMADVAISGHFTVRHFWHRDTLYLDYSQLVGARYSSE